MFALGCLQENRPPKQARTNPGDTKPAHEIMLWEKEIPQNRVLKGLGLPPMAVLFDWRTRLFLQAFNDSNGPNGSPGTGIPFTDASHAYNCCGASDCQTSNRVFGEWPQLCF